MQARLTQGLTGSNLPICQIDTTYLGHHSSKLTAYFRQGNELAPPVLFKWSSFKGRTLLNADLSHVDFSKGSIIVTIGS